METTYTYQNAGTRLFAGQYLQGSRHHHRTGQTSWMIRAKSIFTGITFFISEPGKGIHILDNTDPSSPRNLNFINIPGTGDLAINESILYADNYVDLLAFDISDPQNIEMVNREEDVFPNLYSNEETGTIVTYKDTLITSTDPNMAWSSWGRPAIQIGFYGHGICGLFQ